MKRMKRILAGLLVACMMLAVVGCGGGGEEKTVTLRADMSEDMGVPTTDTMILTAKGDTIQTLKEVMEMDFSDVDDELKEYFISTLDSAFVAAAQDIDGVTCSSKTTNSVYTIELTVDCTNGDTVKAAADAGFIELEEGLTSKLSLNATLSGLKASGYEEVE